MIQRLKHLRFIIFLAVSSAISLSGHRARTQNITIDGTLGTSGALKSPNYVILQSDGQTIGNNLFHSFGKFNLNTNEAAIFQSDVNIRNIFSRVTGGTPSSINGLIRTLNSNANFFLINPSGIIFGKNARLDVGGSFVASTANALQFGNLGFFSATDKNVPSPLLTINPSAFLFNQLNPAPIVNNSIAVGKNLSGFNTFGLQVPDGRSLLLVGGNIIVDGGKLNAFGGQVHLGGLAAEGTVGLNVDGKNLSLTFPSEVAKADVSVVNNAVIDVTKLPNNTKLETKESLSVQANTLSMRSGKIKASGGIDIKVGLLSLDKSEISNNAINNRGISIQADSIALDNYSSFLNDNFFLDSLQPNKKFEFVNESGSTNIKTNSLFLTNNSSLIAKNYSIGKPGDVNIDARDRITIDNSKITTEIGWEQRDSGNITIKAGSLELQNSSAITSQIDAIGKTGDISIQAGLVSLANDSLISTQNSGQGNAGNILVQSDDSISVVNSLITSRILKGVGNSGNIKIESRSLSLLDGGEIQALTFGEKGNAGQIEVNASDFINISGVAPIGFSKTIQIPFGGESSGLFTTTEAGANGQGGEIKVSTKTLRISNSGVLSARTRNAFKGGDITVNVNTLELTGGGQILTTAFGSGNAGAIAINATDSITLSGNDPFYFDRRAQFGRRAVDPVSPQSGIFTSTQGLGTGGNLTIVTGKLRLQDGAQISTLAGSVGNLSTIDEAGDAGLLLNEYQTGEEQPYGTPLTRIRGSLNGSDADLYKIQITGNGTFSASTVGETKLNTSLFLFNADGIGVYSNDNDVSSGTIQSVLPANNPLTPSAPGIYYLGISNSAYRLVPRSSKGSIFGSARFGINAPNGLGGKLPLSSWESDQVLFGGGNSYTITLTGTEFATSAPIIGDGGNITINARTLEAINSGQILTSTRSNGNAGRTILNVKDSVILSGKDSGVFANTLRESTGRGGDIKIATGQLTVRDGAQITASSQGSGNAGNISNIAANTIKLNNGAITTTSTGGEGGNIKLQVRELLLLRNHSQISSTAGTEYSSGGNGGNIIIEAPFIVGIPYENSDITANAFNGNGGTVSIKANNILGMTVRSREDLVKLLVTREPQNLNPEKLPTSDVTAISHTSPTLSGQVLISTPEVDPSRGLVELPTNLIDASGAIIQSCIPRQGQTTSQFISTGRGGLPLSPDQPLRGRAVITKWVDIDSRNQQIRETREERESITQNSTPNKIVEAQGWVVSQGNVYLVAQAPVGNSNTSLQQATLNCNAAK